ncbi:hypothetical protein [Microcoleus sp. D2_18a_D3]|uniref:hypothetical protein n=1 Tax=Microcoleus sp. D2_18a_D3 TaxID=3055330 RepID=UPI002FCF0561
MSAISRRKFGNGLCNGCNGCNGCQEEGSSATDSLDGCNGCKGCQEGGRRKKREEGGRGKREEGRTDTLHIVNKAVRGGRDTQPKRILNYCGTGRKSC